MRRHRSAAWAVLASATVLATAAPSALGSAPPTTGVTLTEFPLPAGVAPGDIADSIDGRMLWVTLTQTPTGDVRSTDGVNSVGRFDTATGALEILKLPTPGLPRSVAVDGDGRVYVLSQTAPFANDSKLNILDPATRTWSERLLDVEAGPLVGAAGRIWLVGQVREDPTDPFKPPPAPEASSVIQRLLSVDAAGSLVKYPHPDRLPPYFGSPSDPPKAADSYLELNAGLDGGIWIGGGRGPNSGGLLIRFDPGTATWSTRTVPGGFLREIAVPPGGEVWWSSSGGFEASDALYHLPSFAQPEPDVAASAAFNYNMDLEMAGDGTLIAASSEGVTRVDRSGVRTATAFPGIDSAGTGEIGRVGADLWVSRPGAGALTKVRLGGGASSTVRQAVAQGINTTAACPGACTVTSQILAPAPATRGARAAARPRRIVVATGRRTRKAAGYALVRNRYNAAGRRLLRRAGAVRLDVRVVVRSGGRVTRSASALTIRR